MLFILLLHIYDRVSLCNKRNCNREDNYFDFSNSLLFSLFVATHSSTENEKNELVFLNKKDFYVRDRNVGLLSQKWKSAECGILSPRCIYVTRGIHDRKETCSNFLCGPFHRLA